MAATSHHVNDITSSSEADFPASSTSRSISHATVEVSPPLDQKDDESGGDTHSDNDATTSSVSEITSLQSRIKALRITPPSNSDVHNIQEDGQPIYGNSVIQHQVPQHYNNLNQTFMPQILSHGMNNAYLDPNHISYLEKFSSPDMQLALQSSGFTPPTYPATAAYVPSVSPYYSALQPPGMIYPPHYGVGGYAFSPSAFPPYLSGYPPHGAVPFSINNPSGLNFSPRASGVPSASGSSNNVDTQNLNSFYGQFSSNQHLFANPDPNRQFRPPYGDFYNVPGHVDPLTLGNVVGGQGTAMNSPRRSEFRVISTNHRPQNQGTGAAATLNQRRGGVPTPSYFGSSTNLGFFMHIPTSSLSSPVLPSSPIGTSNLAYGRNEGTFPLDSSRNASLCAGWPGQQGYESLSHTKTYSFLEELKSGKGRRLELSDIAGHAVEFSVDQHGSRFIQQKLEICSVEEKASLFEEIVSHTSKLMTDVFGNYVIQKFFEYGIPQQRRELANQMKGQILPLSLQMYGCRVIQKALDVIELEQKVELVHELDGHVVVCVRDQNGNHVIQKCIESIPIERIDFVISAFHSQVAALSMHPYGCRVIQRILERCTDEAQTQFIVDEILESACTLAQNQFGNYVTQHVLEKGKSAERIQIIKKLAGRVVEMSQHKFASNVVEKCLEYGDTEGRELLIGEIIGTDEANDNLLVMMKDQYANYVVQKILEMCTDSQRDLLLGRIRVHLAALRKYTYGKHIVARFEQLYGEDVEASGS